MNTRFKKFSLFLFITFLYSIVISAQPVFRWDVKTLTDSSGIDWLHRLELAKDNRLASIEGLTTKPIAFNGCTSHAKNTRRSDEKRVVKLLIRLIKVKSESNDEDYHIVIQSLTDENNFMVAEIPDPETPELQLSQYSDLRTQLQKLRDDIKNLLQENITRTFKDFPPNTIVTIYGVPFYDCKHPSTVSGASVNFREIHPVLEIE
ncbi:MAG: hypothetical protein ABI855_09750 [Bacteroidota bacterium]